MDSDYDYLLQNTNPQSEIINTSPFIFQTYTHSVENYQCYAPNLAQIIVNSTLCQTIADIQGFISAYSVLIYDFFIKTLYLEVKNEQSGSFFDKNSVFYNNIKIGEGVKIDEQAQVLDKLNLKIQSIMPDFSSIDADDFAVFQAQMEQLGVTPTTTYLFIQGHFLKDKIVLLLLEPIRKSLIKAQEKAYNDGNATGTEKKAKIKAYKNQTQALAQALSAHHEYKTCPLYGKIMAKIVIFKETYLATAHF